MDHEISLLIRWVGIVLGGMESALVPCAGSDKDMKGVKKMMTEVNILFNIIAKVLEAGVVLLVSNGPGSYFLQRQFFLLNDWYTQKDIVAKEKDDGKRAL